MSKKALSLDALAERIPQMALERLIEDKFSEIGYPANKDLISNIAKEFLAGKEEFNWDDGLPPNQEITLTLDDNDLKKLEKISKKILKLWPQVLLDTSKTTAAAVLRSLKRRWRKEFALQTAEMGEFKRNLELRWGKPLGKLRLLLTISREVGADYTNNHDDLKNELYEVIIKLHVRACQVTAEIITLLENGFADGAMARWRTLHEISIVILLMQKNGRKLAKRYLEHSAVEAKRAKDLYVSCYERLGYAPISQEDSEEVEKRYQEVLKKYGNDFSQKYGWANGFVMSSNGRSLALGDLEKDVNQSQMASYYKFASYRIHADPHSIFDQLGLLDDSSYLAGASNAGLSEPGQNAGMTLAKITHAILQTDDSLMHLVYAHVLLQLMEEIPDEFIKAENKLIKDHQKLQKNGLA